MKDELRNKPHSLQVMEALNNRMLFSGKDRNYYFALRKGWEGECRFDKVMEKVTSDCILQKDLCLKVNRTVFQLDTVLITPHKVYLYEVKNYEGDYLFDGDVLINLATKNEIINPSIQLKRSRTLLRQLLKQLNCHLPVEAYVVYINPNFTLYQTPANEPILFLSQMTKHVTRLSSQTDRLTDEHILLANRLRALVLPPIDDSNLPKYTYDGLVKGMFCSNCKSKIKILPYLTCYCKECGYKELVSETIFRHVQEFYCLFPNVKITTATICGWCSFVPSHKRVQAVLNQQLKAKGVKRWMHYVFDE